MSVEKTLRDEAAMGYIAGPHLMVQAADEIARLTEENRRLVAEREASKPLEDEHCAAFHAEAELACNRIANGQCQLVACMKRGGWKRGDAVNYDMATCVYFQVDNFLSRTRGEERR